MVKFFKNTVLFIFIIAVILGIANIFLQKKRQENLPENLWAGIIDKHKRLDSLPSPKIMLVGGSNVMFGLSAKMLEDTFKIPAQNLGLGAAFGLPFLLKEVLPSVKKGDVVVISSEYFLDEGVNDVLLYLAEVYPPAKNYFSFNSFMDEIKANMLYKISGIRNAILLAPVAMNASIEDTTNVYFRTALNKQGDIISHENNPAPNFLKDRTKYYPNNKYTIGIQRLNDFSKQVKEKDGTVVFTFPSQPISVCKESKVIFADLAKNIKAGANFIVLDTPEERKLPDSLFFDTVNHLKPKGREIRTYALIQNLRKYKILP